MTKVLILLTTIILINSCQGINKTTDNSIVELQKVENNPVETQEENLEMESNYLKGVNHALWTELLQKHVSSQGNVNYKGFKTDEIKLKNYFQSLSENTVEDSWSKAEKLAYWINAYNAFTIQLIIDNYPVKSIKDINSPWDQRFIKLGEKSYSLNDIEHEILRKMGDARIHFAIVCASVSCPKLLNKAFEASKLEAQLNAATKAFLTDPERNNLSENKIEISKIFKWFSSDFKQNGSLIDFLNKYSEITISENASKSYKDYNWDLNE